MNVAGQTIDPSLLAQMQELVDRQKIYECLMRFSRGIDRFDRDMMVSAFHPDAQDDHGAFVGAPNGLYDFAAGLHGIGQYNTQHHITNHSCELDGDTAHTESYYLFTGRNRDDKTVWVATGRYIDRFEKRKGEWKIAFRYCVVEWSGLLPASAIPFSDIPDVHKNGVPGRDRNDPSYRRPLTNKRPEVFPPSLEELSKPKGS
jgi:hypothetical protein